MPKVVDVPRYHVLSGRFSDEENEWFRQQAVAQGVSISSLVRDILIKWKEGACAARSVEA